MNRPNILYLHTHDLGRYCQPYGHAIPMPNMQRLAEGGVVFRQAFCAAPTCSSSRAALLTGQYPHSCGLPGLVNRGFELEHVDRHIVHTLRAAGYHSALIGLQHIRSDSTTIGYDEVANVGWDNIQDAAAEWFASAPHQPFFVSVGFADTHREFAEPGPAEDERYCLPPAPLPHGIAFPSMKCNLNQHGMGVALVMRGLGGFTGGQVCDALISHVDVFPTMCDLLGIKSPEWLQGRSFMPVIRGEADEVNEHIYGEVTWHAACEPMRSVRTKRYNYIRRFDGRTRPVLPNCDDGPAKSVWIDSGWRDLPVAEEQLYDLIFDPNEVNNVAVDRAMEDVLDDMRGRVDGFMHETDDPLLGGPLTPPPGVTYNDPDGSSPNDPLITAQCTGDADDIA